MCVGACLFAHIDFLPPDFSCSHHVHPAAIAGKFLPAHGHHRPNENQKKVPPPPPTRATCPSYPLTVYRWLRIPSLPAKPTPEGHKAFPGVRAYASSSGSWPMMDLGCPHVMPYYCRGAPRQDKVVDQCRLHISSVGKWE